MKKQALILLAFVFTAKLCSAQIDAREEVQFGLKLGFNIANVYDESDKDFEADGKLGLAAGISLSLPLGQFLGFQPELLLSQKGFKGTGFLLGSSYEIKRTSSYIDIPLLIALKPSPFVSILVGPQYAYLINQKDEFSNSNNIIAQEQAYDNDNLRKNIFGFVTGLDINLDHLTVGGRLGWDLQRNNGDGTSETPRYKNVWFQTTLAYKIF